MEQDEDETIHAALTLTVEHDLTDEQTLALTVLCAHCRCGMVNWIYQNGGPRSFGS